MKIRNQRRRGQGLVEYALIICGVALVGAVSVSEFGHKTQDLISAVAVMLPGAHQGDNFPIIGGHLLETTTTANGVVGTPAIVLDTATIAGETNQARLGQNLFNDTTNGIENMIIESR